MAKAVNFITRNWVYFALGGVIGWIPPTTIFFLRGNSINMTGAMLLVSGGPGAILGLIIGALTKRKLGALIGGLLPAIFFGCWATWVSG